MRLWAKITISWHTSCFKKKTDCGRHTHFLGEIFFSPVTQAKIKYIFGRNFFFHLYGDLESWYMRCEWYTTADGFYKLSTVSASCGYVDKLCALLRLSLLNVACMQHRISQGLCLTEFKFSCCSLVRITYF
jgi:hypothetical protein